MLEKERRKRATDQGILHELREEVVSLRESVANQIFELRKDIEDLKKELQEITNRKNTTV